MAKKIPCRVVRSVPLSKSCYGLRHTSRLNNKHHRVGDVDAGAARASGCVWEPAVDVRGRDAGNSVTYTGRLGIARVSVDDALAGLILDCYV
ncbi:MAG: hypothetical protein ACYS83_02955 [Planctomycetota bacterium]|jgi:hypothetical protein